MQSVLTWPLLIAAPAGAQAAVRYVAVGDSYSAGDGAGAYYGGHLYDLAKSSSCIGLSTTDRVDLNQGADQLDSAIQAAAERHGEVFADVRAQFAGQEICDSNSWLNSVNWLDLGSSYHPNAAGQADGCLPVFSEPAAG